jgi:hypothetical protein
VVEKSAENGGKLSDFEKRSNVFLKSESFYYRPG